MPAGFPRSKAILEQTNEEYGLGHSFGVIFGIFRPQGLWLKENSEKFVLGKEIGAYLMLRVTVGDISRHLQKAERSSKTGRRNWVEMKFIGCLPT